MGRIRKLIQQSVKKWNIKKYLFYALGEIILIVVGVLLAVNINNFNDKNSKEQNLKLVLENISKDLNSDAINLTRIIAVYEEKDSVIVNLIESNYPQDYSKSINQENFMDCKPCFAQHIGFKTFSAKLDGYNQLKEYSLGSKELNSKLIHEVLFFYKNYLAEIELVEEILAKTTLNNVESLEKHDWYADFMMNRYNKAAIDYFLNNSVYKNKLVTFKLLAIENHLSLLKEYKKKANEIKLKIRR